jgi:glycosyltransferase involved in cell wall biosynthesis
VSEVVQPNAMAADTAGPDVVHVLPDKFGGVHSLCANLLAHRGAGLPHGVVLTHNVWSVDRRPVSRLRADWERTVEESLPAENLYAALRRVRQAIAGQGALVANDWIELATASAFRLDRTVFNIVHADSPFYYDLALRHEPDIDVYITFTDAIHRAVVELLPHRAADVVQCRHGVALTAPRRAQAQGTQSPLRVVFTGRVDRSKGVFDLPAIDARLRADNVHVAWTVQGDGPDLQALREVWPRPDVRWLGQRTVDQVVDEYARQDVFVLSSPKEGLPVALLEAGAAGLVPVVSDLPSGFPEIVHNGDTGWRIAPGDVAGFASAIASLAADRESLERMSGAVRNVIARDWDITRNAVAYQRLFEQWRERRRPRPAARVVPYGSRLDQRWLPNSVVKAVRRMTLNTAERGGRL